MPITPLQQRINARIQGTDDAASQTEDEVRALQSSAFGDIVSWAVDRLDVGENGRLTYGVKNFGAVAGVYRLFSRLGRMYQDSLLGMVLHWSRKILGLNEDYFTEFTQTGTIQEQALFQTLLRWGYNTKNGEILPGGYFEALFKTDAVAQKVASLVNRAIIQKMSLTEFQKTFKDIFVGQPGAGMLERHWNTNSFDLYQRIDRTANKVYADKLGLNWAIYSGTLMKDSRPFCIARVNKAYTRDEIAAWESLSFAGKPKFNYDPFLDCGGYNCRHHLSWVSDQVGQAVKAKEK